VNRPRPFRLPVVLAAGLAVALAAAAPAGATEGQPGSPPPSWAVTPPVFQLPTAFQLPTHAVRTRALIRGARIVPRRVRLGRRAVLRMTLSRPARVRIAISRRSRPHRGRVTVRRVLVPAGRVAIRLPRRIRGRALATGRYRVSMVAVDAEGIRSRTLRRSFVVRAARP
jgi:hypothetical protein